MPDLSIELGVPAYALPGGGEIYCWGLHAGMKKRFRARVVKLRPTFPRIVVRFVALEDGTVPANDLLLPEMKTAYVTMQDIAPIN